MIGVIADSAEHDVVREFFELFKTPWEFYRADRRYDVLLCSGTSQIDAAAKLIVCFAGKKVHFDDERKIQTSREVKQPCILSYHGNRIPIYGATVRLPEQGNGLLTKEDSKECMAYLGEANGSFLARIGYDLFQEVRTLLTVGQPAVNASMPAVELHIAFLRDLITGCGIPLVEIPPVPDGYQFVACLTHDVDHPSIRQHKLDHTMFGFLYRAVFGSLLNLIRGRLSVQDLLTNWAAALKLPFVYLGVAKDFWREFDTRYLELEKGLGSTFFVIPFRDQPGTSARGLAPALRAARYGAPDISEAIQKLTTAGCEVGLHGIDAWVDSTGGRQELSEIRRLTGTSEIGVRMHWLCYDQQSPLVLESVGMAYDSTIGYNGTVGYRAGTTQVYKPLNANHLLELPLHVMDTALFYPCHLGLSPKQAKVLTNQMLDNAVSFGGALTINWHDRSLAPERLWGNLYLDLLQDLKKGGAWFATAGQAVSWFRKRRAASFEMESVEPGATSVRVAVNHADKLPGLRLRIHKAQKPGPRIAHRPQDYVDKQVDESVDTGVPFEASR